MRWFDTEIAIRGRRVGVLLRHSELEVPARAFFWGPINVWSYGSWITEHVEVHVKFLNCNISPLWNILKFLENETRTHHVWTIFGQQIERVATLKWFGELQNPSSLHSHIFLWWWKYPVENFELSKMTISFIITQLTTVTELGNLWIRVGTNAFLWLRWISQNDLSS